MRSIAIGSFGWAVAREAGASLLTYQLYPLGVLGRSTPLLPSFKRTESGNIPLLFIHGIFHNRSAFAWLVQKLAVNGFRNIREMNLFTSVNSIPRLADQVARMVELTCEENGSDHVNIIAHSLGGIVARYFVQELGGDGRVKNLFTLGSPHRGTTISRYSVLPHIRELRPNSSLMQKLNSGPPPKRTRAVAISGDLDIFMTPTDTDWWNGARNIRLKGVGHAGILFSDRVLSILLSHLGDEAV